MSLSEAEARFRDEARSLDMFDASAWLGSSSAFPLMEEGTPQLVQNVLAGAHINGALVSHWMGSQDCSQESNQVLLREIEGYGNWYATITLNPPFPQDQGSPGLAEWEWPERAKAVRVFPASFRYALVDWCVGTLCELLIDRHLPLFVFHTETSFQELYSLATRYPQLRIVLESQVRKILYHSRMVLALMKACPSVLLEISNYCALGLIEYTVNALGPGRLVFGTFVPANDPLVPLGLLLQADISQDDKRAIAGGTVRQIISEVRT